MLITVHINNDFFKKILHPTIYIAFSDAFTLMISFVFFHELLMNFTNYYITYLFFNFIFSLYEKLVIANLIGL